MLSSGGCPPFYRLHADSVTKNMDAPLLRAILVQGRFRLFDFRIPGPRYPEMHSAVKPSSGCLNLLSLSFLLRKPGNARSLQLDSLNAPHHGDDEGVSALGAPEPCHREMRSRKSPAICRTNWANKAGLL